MAGLGIDLIEIDRLERALALRPRLAERLFSPGERRYAEGRPRPGQHLAARFCAKEAVVKALGLEIMRPLEVEVVEGGRRAALRLRGETAAYARMLGVDLHLSLTHTKTVAGAVVVAR